MKSVADIIAEQDASHYANMDLYHGSMYKQNELMPGFKRSGELSNWDRYESNMYLYVSSHRNSAVLLGIASAMEKTHDLSSVSINEKDKTIIAKFNKKPPPVDDLYDLEVYLYTIAYRAEDGWVKNKNPFNKIETEYKTKNTIKEAIVSCQRVNVREVLKDFTFTFSS